MKIRKVLFLTILGAFFVLPMSFVMAQPGMMNEEMVQPATDQPEDLPLDAAETEDGEEYSYGTVKTASAEQIIVMEYDYDGEENVEMTYKINGETQFENVASSGELVEGDSIEIYYNQSGQDKVATRIIKEVFDEEIINDEYSAEPPSGDEQEPVLAPAINATK